MKFPYGISDFNKIITKGYFYCDRTDRIRLLEDIGDSLLFLRPRQFGKSLLLSMLANYYDVALKDRFDQLFGNLLIGKNPTPLHNKYFILNWDFSCVDSIGGAAEIKKALHDHINSSIKEFLLYYKDYIDTPVEVDPQDAINSIYSLATAIKRADYKIYLLIDEYDYLANKVKVGLSKDQYEDLLYEEGQIKSIFKVVKAFTSSLFDRTFITGILPFVMSDITSGYNIAHNIYLEPELNDLCGFTEKEIEQVLDTVTDKWEMKDVRVKGALETMRSYFNGYSFSYRTLQSVYHPMLSITFLENFYKGYDYPHEMINSDLSADEAKVRYILELSQGRDMIGELVKDNKGIEISNLENRFGINQMLSYESRDYTFIASFFYYSGLITMAGETSAGSLLLKTPNLFERGFLELLLEIKTRFWG